ncbi:MAG: helix-turn-helix domain-containing protein [Firmicutes bacterium]|nr:helix-turn-helix domain-containing protein [Bacillota bacterium]
MVTQVALLRFKTGVTAREFAKAVGIPEVTMYRIERGRQYVPPKWRRPLAEALGVSEEEICDPKTGWPRLVA